MIWRSIAVLLTLWCSVALIPALVIEHLLRSTAHGAAIGWVVGIWVVGYVVQLVVFVMVSRLSPVGTGVGRVLAALVPWLADWTVLVTPWCLVPFVVISVGYSAWLSRSVYRVDVLRRDGIWGQAVVQEVVRPTLTVVMKNDKTRRTVRVHVADSPAKPGYETQFDATFTVGAIPEPGDTLAIRIDPTRPQHVEMIEGEPVIRAAANIADVAPENVEQLRRLTAMRDRGDLSDAEYAAAKARLLNS